MQPLQAETTMMVNMLRSLRCITTMMTWKVVFPESTDSNMLGLNGTDMTKLCETVHGIDAQRKSQQLRRPLHLLRMSIVSNLGSAWHARTTRQDNISKPFSLSLVFDFSGSVDLSTSRPASLFILFVVLRFVFLIVKHVHHVPMGMSNLQ